MKYSFPSAAIIAVLLAGCAGSKTPMQTQDAQDPWVIRTDFSDDAKWTAVREQIAAPQTDFGQRFYAYVQYVSDEKYSGIECNDLVHSLPDDYQRTPKQTPVGDIRTFRAIPSTIQSIENNLSIANMDFEDFADSVGEDGVFRGFPR